ncbi:MAG: AmmeMemoRadiSam system protein B [Phycisphaerae bacterium]|nr:AmmeMemoRadiSam system protein B [Phycisphaerae bacterium]
MVRRTPIADGRFYPGSPADCRRAATDLLESATLPSNLPNMCIGGIAPHAGWMFSGALAAMTLKALLGGTDGSDNTEKTVVLFGADHTGVVQVGEVFPAGCWETPLGDVAVDEQLVTGLLESDACEELLRSNPAAHKHEHSLEVLLPLIATIAPGAKILPIAVPPNARAVDIGCAVGATIQQLGRGGDVVIVGSTDLTHHGGHFGYVGGSGRESEVFARENDHRLLGIIEAMDAGAIIPETTRNHNACGAGAVAATMSTVQQLGATQAKILGYTNSYEVLHGDADSPDDATVGYASVVFA